MGREDKEKSNNKNQTNDFDRRGVKDCADNILYAHRYIGLIKALFFFNRIFSIFRISLVLSNSICGSTECCFKYACFS